MIPSLLAKLVLLENGWNAVNLGPHTPAFSFLKALDEFQPKLIWLSLTHGLSEDAFLEKYLPLIRKADGLKVPVVVGGQALTESLRKKLKGIIAGDSMATLASVARAIHPLPTRPKRGKPSQK
jgi:methanogenic corrinoid protein MtbC1